MSKLIKRLEAELPNCTPPPWLADNIQYLTMMGSITYGCATDVSDKDVYGCAVPPKATIFPWTAGLLPGFDTVQGFDQWQQHHLKSTDGNEYDFNVMGIIKYFKLLMDNNPNVIDSLFTRTEHVLHVTKAFEVVRENRTLFLHKGSWHKFKGYAFSQVGKMRDKNARAWVDICDRCDWSLGISLEEVVSLMPEKTTDRDDIIRVMKLVSQNGNRSKRMKTIQKFGYDVKFAYHVVRLLNECEQIFQEGTIDLMRDKEMLKSIRRGEWKEQDVYDWFEMKKMSLEKLYYSDTVAIPHRPDRDAIRKLLLNVLEHHYGALDKIVQTQRSDSDKIVEEIRRLVG